MLSEAHIFDIEYPQGKSSPLFFDEDFSALLAQPSISFNQIFKFNINKV